VGWGGGGKGGGGKGGEIKREIGKRGRHPHQLEYGTVPSLVKMEGRGTASGDGWGSNGAKVHRMQAALTGPAHP